MKPDHMACPHNECNKEFEKPVVLTDLSRTPRETYYACPHCLTKVDVVTEDPKLSSVSVGIPKNPVNRSPVDCGYHLGYLKALPKEASIPEGCLICPELLQCFVKRENIRQEVK